MRSCKHGRTETSCGDCAGERLGYTPSENTEVGMSKISRLVDTEYNEQQLRERLKDEIEAHAQLQSRCFDGSGGQSIFDRVKDLERIVAERKQAVIAVELDRCVTNFLGWKLPPDFHPDAGITFTPKHSLGTAHARNHEPTGTNLFDADQARAMFAYCLLGSVSDATIHYTVPTSDMSCELTCKNKGNGGICGQCFS